MSESNPYAEIVAVFAEARASDAPLNERLDRLAEAIRRGSPEFSPVVDGLIGRLNSVGCGQHAPDVGQLMPDFLLPDISGNLVGLTQVLKGGPAIVSFYRGHWCPYCSLSAETYGRLSATVGPSHMVAITPELRKLNAQFAANTGMTYPVLTDIDCGYALSLGLAFWLDERFADLLRGIGRDLATYHAGAGWILPIPATFVVDSHGIVVRRHVDPDYRRRMEVEDLLEAFRAAT